jgi:hypothetical protein
MKSRNWKDTAEHFGIVAIVMSLVFVGFQMRQDQVIARSELTSHSFDLMLGFNQFLFDESFAGTFAKMLEHPEELDARELVRIDSLLNSVMLAYLRECYLVDRGIFEECTNILNATAERYFGNKYARLWLEQRKDKIRPLVFDQLEERLANVETK